MLTVQLMGNEEEIDTFFNEYGSQHFEEPILFVHGACQYGKHVPQLKITLTDYKFLNAMCWYRATLSKLAPEHTDDNGQVRLYAQMRFQEWKQAQYPNGDPGVGWLLDPMSDTMRFPPMWSCTGHIDVQDDGYLVLTGTTSNLLSLSGLLAESFSDVETFTLELGTLQWPMPTLGQTIVYPGLILRWSPQPEATLESFLGSIAERINSAIGQL